MSTYNKRLLVTGASGLLGNKIVELAKNDWTVIPVHRTKPLNSTSLELGITDATEVLNLLGEIKPDVVIHTASKTNINSSTGQVIAIVLS